MRQCNKCHLDGDEDSFYPDPKQLWCKLCINTLRRSRSDSIREQALKAQREQDAIVSVVSTFQSNKEPYVYLIESENKYKIGYSRNIYNRIRAFNTSHGIPCKIIAVVPGDTSLETELHNILDVHRINREWFKKTTAVLREFRKLADVMVFLPGEAR